MKRVLGSCLIAAALSSTASADEPRRLEIAGGALFGASYAVPIGLAIRYEQGELAVPVLGPLIDLRRCHDCTGNPAQSGIIAGLVIDFALQAAGVALFTVGLIKHRQKHATAARSIRQEGKQ
jgi:hypothetical protein